MRIKILNLLIILPATLSLTSCGDKKVATTELSGTWKTACSTLSGKNYKFTQTYTATAATSLVEGFAEASCTTLEYSQNYTATYTIGAALTTPAGSKELDVTLGSVVYHATTAAGKTELENNCTGHTFALGQDVTVTGECDEKAAGSIDYSSFKIDNTVSPNTLSMPTGDDGTNDGSTAAKRNTAVNTAFPFIKQ